MNEQGGPWPAYTIGYGESFADDELTDAAETASLLGARHVTVKLDQSEFERSLPKIVECLEEPIAASSIVPMYFVSQRARQDVKVALIGQGPDELFGGYKRHLGVHYGDWWRGLPAGLRSMAGFAVNRLPRNEMLKRGVRSLGSEDRLKRYQDVFSLAPAETIDGLFRDDVLPEKQMATNWSSIGVHCCRKWSIPMSSAAFSFLKSALRCPMSCSCMPTSSPWRTVSKFACPTWIARWWSTCNGSARILKSAMELGNGCIDRFARAICRREFLSGKKRGFAANVVDEWFHSSLNGELREVLLDESSLMFGLLDPKPVRRLLEGHQSGRQDNHKLLFSLVMIEQWLRRTESDQERRAEMDNRA